MSLHVIWLVILLSFVYKTNGDGVWEFGINSKNSMIILQKSGTINLFEKYTQVPLTVSFKICLLTKTYREELGV